MTCLHCKRELTRKVYGMRKESIGEFAKRKYCDVVCSKGGRRKRLCVHGSIIGDPCRFCDRVRRLVA